MQSRRLPAVALNARGNLTARRRVELAKSLAVNPSLCVVIAIRDAVKQIAKHRRSDRDACV